MNRLTSAIVAMLAMAVLTWALPEKAAAQKKERTVYMGGEVYDSFTKARIKAIVTVTNKDSTLVKTDTCTLWNTYAEYYINVPRREDHYTIKAEADGYETAYAEYHLTPRGRKRYYEVPRILMKRGGNDIYKNVGLNEVVVRGTRVQIAYRGDTIVYDASAFNLPEGSMLDALIRQMPGAELKDDGTIYVNGQKVDNLMLNGKDFFKGKNKIMLENLPYFTVKDVKVYHKSTERSELMGRDIEPKELVMDVGLKRQYARSYIANAEAGAGTDDRWTGRLFGLYFDDHTRVTLFGNANNVNESRKPGSDGDWSPVKLSRGLLTTRQTGLNLQTEDKDKRVMENFEASLKWDDTDSERHNVTETFASGGNITGGSSSWSSDKDFNLELSNRLRLPKLHLTSDATLTYTNSRRSSAGRDSTLRDTLTNRSWNNALSRSRRLSFRGYTFWSHPLPWGDYLSLYASYNYYNNRPNETFSLNNTQYAAGGPVDRRNNYADTRSNGYRYRFTFGYDLILLNNWTINANVAYGQTNDINDNKRYRLDWLDNDSYDIPGLLPSTTDSLLMALDRDNSAYTNTMQREYSGELQIYRSKNNSYFFITLPISRYSERLAYRRSTLDTTATRTYTEFRPNFYMSLKKGKNQHKLNYYMYVNQPDFASLMPYDNTTNPLALTLNNPNLKALKRQHIDWQSTFRCDSIDLAWYIGADANLVIDDIGTRTTYNSTTGAYTYMDDNVDGNWDLNLKLGLNGTLDRQKRLRYVFDANAKYIHSVDFDVAYDTPADVLSTVKTVRTGARLSLSYTKGKFTAGLLGKLTSRHSRGDRAGFEPIDVFDYQYGANLQYTIPVLKLNLSTDINMFSRRGYGSPEMNTDDLGWNAQLSRTFCKGALTAKLTAYDILKQISTKTYSINAQGRTETRFNCIPRYVMFSLAYRFTKKPKQTEQQ